MTGVTLTSLSCNRRLNTVVIDGWVTSRFVGKSTTNLGHRPSLAWTLRRVRSLSHHTGSRDFVAHTCVRRARISAIAFYAGKLTAYGLILGTFTGLMVGVASACEASPLKRFCTSPVPPNAYLLGQILFNVLISLALVIVMMSITSLVYGQKLQLTVPVAMLCFTLLGVFTLTAIVLALARLISTPKFGSTVSLFVATMLSFSPVTCDSGERIGNWQRVQRSAARSLVCGATPIATKSRRVESA